MLIPKLILGANGKLATFDPTKKKKNVLPDLADDFVDKLAEKTESLSVNDGLDNTFVGLKKKKKKPVEARALNDENEDPRDDLDDHAGEDEDTDGAVPQQIYPWEGSDRDYQYEELLGRVFNILRENNPELAGDRRTTVMRPPQVLREGTKKTVFVNFMDLCKTMHRQPDHVQAFLLAELGTSGSLDGQQRLVVKGSVVLDDRLLQSKQVSLLVRDVGMQGHDVSRDSTYNVLSYMSLRVLNLLPALCRQKLCFVGTFRSPGRDRKSKGTGNLLTIINDKSTARFRAYLCAHKIWHWFQLKGPLEGLNMSKSISRPSEGNPVGRWL
ncbi:hypothetical protein CDL15_Pgr022002 [Punica granatum]|uniref:Eukaryotic translation initiation factor 2 subunit beta n=1 Tax=Punica granatum TaxID=22663 RepID=A0A218W2Y1_PUNGR|nr:hypothetical protein CDL15_Pgr022002 [Punica granatum]